MKYAVCILIGYLIGTVNPSYIIAKIKGFDIRERGSKNAGASNALILFGKFFGIGCALFDIFKTVLAVWICRLLFPDFRLAFVLSSFSCMMGHIFPFYMNFRGGKGLSCLGGMVLAFDWRVFLMMLGGALIVALGSKYICFVPMTASVCFPFVYGIMRKDWLGAGILCLMIPVVMIRHKENLIRIKNGTELRLSFLWNKSKEAERLNLPKE